MLIGALDFFLMDGRGLRLDAFFYLAVLDIDNERGRDKFRNHHAWRRYGRPWAVSSARNARTRNFSFFNGPGGSPLRPVGSKMGGGIACP